MPRYFLHYLLLENKAGILGGFNPPNGNGHDYNERSFPYQVARWIPSSRPCDLECQAEQVHKTKSKISHTCRS